MSVYVSSVSSILFCRWQKYSGVSSFEWVNECTASSNFVSLNLLKEVVQ